MGGDFIFAVAPVHESVDREEALRRIEQLTYEDYELLADVLLHDPLVEGLQPEEVEDIKEQIRDILKDAVWHVFKHLEGADFREIGSFDHGDTAFVLTGGMSWGDPPTDAFHLILAFQLAGLGDDRRES